jgi:ParB family chromosome partitioning protein
MARRRLAPVDPARLALPLDPGGRRAEADSPQDVPRAERAPIARVAAEAAAGAALEEMAETLRAARDEGRMVLDLPLDSVASDHLARDRIGLEEGEMAALRESIRSHGQRHPIEVVALTGPLPYGLVSGWRRLAALRALHAETGEARFATVRALVLRPADAGEAYVAMVEENEIRVGLSYYERARIVALSVARGVFPDEATARRRLFATASRPKRSRIGAFGEIYHALDAHLRFPAAIPERLGLRLVERLREGQGERIAAALAAAAPADAAAEIALLEELSQPARAKPPRPAPALEEVRPGLHMALRPGGGGWTLVLKGRGMTPALAAEIRDLIERMEG